MSFNIYVYASQLGKQHNKNMISKPTHRFLYLLIYISNLKNSTELKKENG